MKLKHVNIILIIIAVLGLIGTVVLEVAGPEKDPVTGESPVWLQLLCIGGLIFSAIVTIGFVIYFGYQGWKKAQQEAEERDRYKIHDIF
jgi:hypothetical protein